MKQSITYMITIWFSLFVSFTSLAQESVFTGLKSETKKAEEYYNNHAFEKAIPIYQHLLLKDPGNIELMLKLANCSFLTNNMQNAVSWFNEIEKHNGQFTAEDELRFASALHATGSYDEAIIRLTNYLKQFPDDIEISKKVWQLQNIHFLQEDSLYYQIRRLNINSPNDDIGPAYFGNSLIFVSNRKKVSMINRMDAGDNKPYFTWYSSELVDNDNNFVTPSVHSKLFAKEIKSKYHKGGIAFSKDEKTMVYALVVGNKSNEQITSKLFFAEQEGKKWHEKTSFPFNNSSYSISHPFLSDNGKRIYFSSDMSGGYGGMDLYYSDYLNGNWAKPVNLGEDINSSQNEGHPFLFNNTLYFSSNGHPGLGGIDIFSVDLATKPLEIVNSGYPVNTFHDDFNLVLDYTGKTGFFCSNREQRLNLGDDIYTVRFTKLTFPLQVRGKISYKKSELEEDKHGLIDLSNASIELVNKESQETVFKSSTDGHGNFTIEIPYESQFLLRVKQNELGVAIVSMEIPKNHQDYLSHDIVIVQDLFNTLQKQNNSAK